MYVHTYVHMYVCVFKSREEKLQMSANKCAVHDGGAAKEREINGRNTKMTISEKKKTDYESTKFRKESQNSQRALEVMRRVCY